MPLVRSVSAREPASIQTPTVLVWAYGECSVAIYQTLISTHSSLCQYGSSMATYRKAIAQSGALGGTAAVDGGCETPDEAWLLCDPRLHSGDGFLGAQALVQSQSETSRSHGRGGGRKERIVAVQIELAVSFAGRSDVFCQDGRSLKGVLRDSLRVGSSRHGEVQPIIANSMTAPSASPLSSNK